MSVLPFNWELPVNWPILRTILIAFFTQPPPPDSRNGVIRGYYITYKQSNKHYRRKNFTVNGGKARSYVISNLHPFTEYQIEIQAFTRAGVSPVLRNAKAVVTHEDGKQTHEYSSALFICMKAIELQSYYHHCKWLHWSLSFPKFIFNSLCKLPTAFLLPISFRLNHIWIVSFRMLCWCLWSSHSPF